MLTGMRNRLNLMISIDMATYVDGSPGGLISAADQALYQAKQAVRYRVIVIRPESEVTEPCFALPL